MLGILRIIIPALTCGGALFFQLQIYLCGGNGHLRLSSKFHTDIQDWGCLLDVIDYIVDRKSVV